MNSTPRLPPGWKLLSGTQAKLEAIEQKIMSRDQNFDVVLVVPPEGTGPILVAIGGHIRCHGCHQEFPFARDTFFGAGMGSGKVRCSCGSEVTVMDCDARDGRGTFVVVSPFTSVRGQDVQGSSLEVAEVRLR